MLVSPWSRFAAPALVATVVSSAAAQPKGEPDGAATADGADGAPLGMLLAGGATIDLVPGLAPVAHIATDARLWGSSRWRLGLLYCPGDGVHVGERRYSARLTAATASACVRVAGGDDGHMLGCAGLIGGSLHPVGYEPQRTSFGALAWGGVRVDVGFAVALSDRFWVEGKAVALAPVTRWQHVDEDEPTGFTQPWVIPSAELAIGVRFGSAEQPARDSRPVPTAPRVDQPMPAPEGNDEATAPPQLPTLGGGRTPRGPPAATPLAPPEPPAPAPKGEPLHPDDVQRTISRYTRAVSHRCWERALDLRDGTAPRTARVSVSLTVAPNGSVNRISSSGDPPGYPALARCITRQVESWKFPTATGETEVDVPFVFAAQ